MSIRTTIGNTFIPPLTDIIYEYAKCHYCHNMLSHLSRTRRTRYEYEGNFFENANGILEVIISPKSGMMHLYVHLSYLKEDISMLLSVEQLVYSMAHLNICELNKINIHTIDTEHTDMPICANSPIPLLI